MFDLQGWEYILYEVTQNVHLVSTPFLQKAKYEKSCGTFCVLSIPTAENISLEIFSPFVAFLTNVIRSYQLLPSSILLYDVTSIPTAENIGDEIFSCHLSPF